MTLGLSAGKVALASDHDAWAHAFRRERARIVDAVGARVLAVEHVGSTALPGVPAKPILDILVGVASFEAAFACREPLEALGYTWRGENGIPRRHYFVRGEPRTHHLHMVERASRDWRRTVAFRDHLAARPEVARAYAEAKRALAEELGDDRVGYQRRKDGVIEAILETMDGPEDEA